MSPPLVELAITEITLGVRVRQDLGDVEALAASIADVGLLHPIVVTPDRRLIAGARRLAAVQRLGWSTVPVHEIDLDAVVRGEHAENIYRKDFTAGEAVAIAEALRPLEAAAAKKRQEAAGVHGREGGRGKKKTHPPKTRKGSGESRTRAAKATGYSPATLMKISEVRRLAQEDPETFGGFWARMEKAQRGEIDAIYREASRVAESGDSPPSCPCETTTPPETIDVDMAPAQIERAATLFNRLEQAEKAERVERIIADLTDCLGISDELSAVIAGINALLEPKELFERSLANALHNYRSSTSLESADSPRKRTAKRRMASARTKVNRDNVSDVA